jgi:guanylate kinase
MARRLKAAAGELSHWSEYDYVLVNADLEATLASLAGIVAAERLKRGRQTGLADFVADVLADL